MTIEMNETQINNAIIKMSNSEECLSLRRYYSQDSFLKTLGVSRSETTHSNFIAWLLSPSSNHGLKYYPLQKFLQMLSSVCRDEQNSLAQFPEEYALDFLLENYELTDGCSVNTEEPTGAVAGFDKKGRIDILINLTFKDSNKILPIIIENKVLSTENDENKSDKRAEKNKQTEKYYDWSKEKYKDTDKYKTPILIFLAPDIDCDIKCKCDAFVKISYQNLIEYVIEPCLMSTINEQARYLIENYLRCLSNSTLDKTNSVKEGRIMGFSTKELDLLRKFHEKNKDLIDAVLAMLEHDETDEENRKKLRAARGLSNKHDNGKYTLDGKEYSKGPLMVAMVDKYLNEHSGADVGELKRVFCVKLEFNKKEVVLLPTETPDSLKKKAPERTLSDGTTIYVNNQVQIGDMDRILDIAKALGYDVKKV